MTRPKGLRNESRMKYPSKMNRLWNCVYAHLHCYFWLPCPNCGRYYGGHEIGQWGVPKGKGCWTCTCKWCDDDNELKKNLSGKSSI